MSANQLIFLVYQSQFFVKFMQITYVTKVPTLKSSGKLATRNLNAPYPN